MSTVNAEETMVVILSIKRHRNRFSISGVSCTRCRCGTSCSMNVERRRNISYRVLASIRYVFITPKKSFSQISASFTKSQIFCFVFGACDLGVTIIPLILYDQPER